MICLELVSQIFRLSFLCVVFFFKQKTAYEMRISDWSSDVCSSDLQPRAVVRGADAGRGNRRQLRLPRVVAAPVQAIAPAVFGPGRDGIQIGRASCRDRVCQYV